MTEFRRLPLSTGVTLNVAVAGDRANPAVIFLHGFPESHRTWREVAPRLEEEFFLVMPDQRGFAGSDKPEGVEQYRTERIVEDLIALADALELGRFTLVGHDWGGAVAWLAALRHPDRIARLVAINAPHPYVFQKSLFEDEAQRAASQYITAFRNPMLEKGIEAMGHEAFYEKSFGGHADLALVPAEEKAAYIEQWSAPGALTAMLNWYRAIPLVTSARDERRISLPVLVVWGDRDSALEASLAEASAGLCDDVVVTHLPDAMAASRGDRAGQSTSHDVSRRHAETRRHGTRTSETDARRSLARAVSAQGHRGNGVARPGRKSLSDVGRTVATCT